MSRQQSWNSKLKKYVLYDNGAIEAMQAKPFKGVPIKRARPDSNKDTIPGTKQEDEQSEIQSVGRQVQIDDPIKSEINTDNPPSGKIISIADLLGG